MATDNLPIYKITIDPEYSEDGKDLGIEQIAFTSKPAIKVKGMAFNCNSKPLVFTDNLKYRIVAPALIPMEIYRKDEETDEEYYVTFSVEEIEKIHLKFMKDMNNRDLFNLEHDTEKIAPAYILEAWIVDNPQLDKAYSSFGIEVPKGTLMVMAQVTDKEYYHNLVEEGQIGFSIEGYLGLKLKKQINMNKLPDGEHTIEDKVYVVKDGEIIEIRDVVKDEEVVLEDTAVVEEEEEVVEEEMAVDPALDAEAIIAIVKPVLDEQINLVLDMIAEIKAQLEEMVATDEQEEVVEEAVAMSVQEKFRVFNKFNNK